MRRRSFLIGVGSLAVCSNPAVAFKGHAIGGGAWSSVRAALKLAAQNAINNNAQDLAVMASPPSVAVNTAATAGLTQFLYVGNESNFQFYGGNSIVVVNGSAPGVILPVTDVGPSDTGNLATFVGNTTPSITAQQESVSCAAEFSFSNSQICEIKVRGDTQPYRIMVDGLYVDKAGLTVNNAAQNVWLTLDFGATVSHTVRLEWSGGSSQIRGVSLSAGGSLSVPARKYPYPTAKSGSPVLTMLVAGDSNSEGQNMSPYVGNDIFGPIVGRQLGINDVRMQSVGATGYNVNNSGTRRILFDQIDVWPSSGIDIVWVTQGYNDQGASKATLQPVVLAALQKIRTKYPAALIIVSGPFPGRSGPSAAVLTVESAVNAAFLQWADNNSVYIPFSSVPVISGTGFIGSTNGSGNSDTLIQSDGTHLSNAGHVFAAAYFIAVLRSWLGVS